MSKKIIALLAIVGLITGGIGFFLGKYFFLSQGPIFSSVSSEPDKEVDLSVFWQTWNAIQEEFIGAETLDKQELIYGASSGLIEALDDPYSTFFDPEEAKMFNEALSGIFEGVGMEIGMKDEQLTIISPLEGTPAQKAGLLPKDKIIKIDDQFTQKLSLEEAVSLIRGERGTEVRLTINRPEGFNEKEFSLIREEIEMPSVKWEAQEEEIAYIQLHHFYNNTDQKFEEVAWEILSRPEIKRIVLDLRNNGGGYLNVVQEIGGWFLENGQTIAIEKFSSGEEISLTAEGNSKLVNYPLVVLINQGSASGAEILAGALRDNQEITLIGEETFGKGSVQQPTNLIDGSMIKITCAKWLTPDGLSIDQSGLSPDIAIEMTEEDYEKELDPQLDKALKIIKEISLL
jgi:carboxyl-terminal processing protease